MGKLLNITASVGLDKRCYEGAGGSAEKCKDFTALNFLRWRCFRVLAVSTFALAVPIWVSKLTLSFRRLRWFNWLLPGLAWFLPFSIWLGAFALSCCMLAGIILPYEVISSIPGITGTRGSAFAVCEATLAVVICHGISGFILSQLARG